MALESLGKALNAALGQLEGSAGLEARAVMLWPDIAGEHLARRSEARSVRAGVLVVAVSDGLWAQEIGFQKREFLRRYRQRLGPEVVKDMRTVVKALSSLPVETRTVARPSPAEIARLELTAAEQAEIESVVQAMSPELADAIRHSLTLEAQHRRWSLEHGARPCPRCGAPHRSATDLCPACRVG